ncbi:hypothetical protein N9917_01270 [Deltaproteobacteria bacterium]|nr:hypothetical protein [Deltaproteobacteria bacterium]
MATIIAPAGNGVFNSAPDRLLTEVSVTIDSGGTTGSFTVTQGPQEWTYPVTDAGPTDLAHQLGGEDFVVANTGTSTLSVEVTPHIV